MTEVQTQTTPTPPAADEVKPVVSAPPAADTPSADNATPNPTNPPGATTEMRPGAGGGVDLENMDVNAYERLINQLPGNAAPDLEPAEGGPSGQPHAPAPAQAAPANPPAAEVKPGNQDEEERILPPGQFPNGIKVPTKDDPLAFHTAQIFKESRRNRGNLTLGEAEVMARKMLGMEETPVQQQQQSAPPDAAASPASAPPQGVTTGLRSEQLTAELVALEARFTEASENIDGAEQASVLREINRVNREITAALILESQQESATAAAQVEAENQFLTDWKANEQKAFSMFQHADAANPQSALHQKVVEIQQRYQASQDPADQAIYQSANSPLWYFTLAAQELNIQPGAVTPPAGLSSPQKSTPPPAPPHRPIGPALLASSPAGTTQQPAATGNAIVNSINNVHDLETLIHQLPDAA